jgi:hypothetical protein
MTFEPTQCLVHHVALHPQLGCPRCAVATPSDPIRSLEGEDLDRALAADLVQKVAARAVECPRPAARPSLSEALAGMTAAGSPGATVAAVAQQMREVRRCAADPAPSCPDCGCDGQHTLGCARDDVQWTCDVTPSWWSGGDVQRVAHGVSVALATALAHEPGGSMRVREVRAQRRRLLLLVDAAGLDTVGLLAFRDLVRARVEAAR